MKQSTDAVQPMVLTLGHPALQQIAEPVKNIKARSTQRIIDQLIGLTQEKNGVGIAAPQIGVPLQIIVIASHPTDRYPHAPNMSPMALINPQVVSASESFELDWEGCLSVPDQRAQVLRHRSITVSYTDRVGSQQVTEFTGFVARIFQHEYDHLQGIVFLDRLQDTEAIVDEATYRQMLSV